MDRREFKIFLKKVGEGTFLVAGVLMCLPVLLQMVELFRFLLTLITNVSYSPLICKTFFAQLKISLVFYFVVMVLASGVAFFVFRESPSEDNNK